MSKRVEHKFVGETVDVKVNYDWPEGMVVPYTQVFDGFEAAI
jgi:hypothetical protein